LNKATFSTELITKLMDIYVKPESLVYDSFMGIGTTAKACIERGMNYVGSEISKQQIDHFEEWKKSKQSV
jgi:DNA modification methylase